MKANDPTPTLHALGHASPGEARALLPSSASQVRATEDVATALLLAQSPAPQPLPAGSFAAIQKKITAGEHRRRLIARATHGLQWSGWGVAAALAIWAGSKGLWQVTSEGGGSVATVAPMSDSESATNSAAHLLGKPTASGKGASLATSAVKPTAEQREVRELRSQVEVLQQRLDQLTQPQPGVQRLAIMQPGKGNRNALDSKAIIAIISAALRPAVARHQGASSLTNPEIIIESGYTNFNAADLPEGYYYRHRAFPTEQWQALGLLAAADGSFYDSAGGLLWQPDASGDGSFIGYDPGTDFNASAYTTTLPSGTALANRTVSPASPPPPSVVAIVDPVTGDGQVIVTNPKAAPGENTYVWQEKLDPRTGQVIGHTLVGSSTTPSPLLSGQSGSSPLVNPQRSLAVGPSITVPSVPYGPQPSTPQNFYLGGGAGGLGTLRLSGGDLANQVQFTAPDALKLGATQVLFLHNLTGDGTLVITNGSVLTQPVPPTTSGN